MKKLWLLIVLGLVFSCGKRTPEIDIKEFNERFYDESKFCDLDSLKLKSKEDNKPILLYFTAIGGENCRKMEDEVLSDAEIHTLMHEQFIPFALYLDDKEPIPDRFTEKFSSPPENIGRYHASLQRDLFNNNSQPHFITARYDLTIISEIKMCDKDQFRSFLQKSLEYH